MTNPTHSQEQDLRTALDGVTEALGIILHVTSVPKHKLQDAEFLRGVVCCAKDYAKAADEKIQAALAAPPRPVDAERVAKPSWVDRSAWVAGQIIDMMPRDPDLQPSRGQDGLALPHLLFMADELHGKRVDGDTKACRWLGWLQAGIVNAGLADLETMKKLNLASKEAASPAHSPDKAVTREGVGRRPIEEAPRDGTRLLCLTILGTGKNKHPEWNIGYFDDEQGEWFSEEGSDIDPSHFYDLPDWRPVRLASKPTGTEAGRGVGDHTINGKPFSECTIQALRVEYSAGERMDAMDYVLSAADEERMKALDAELRKRAATPTPPVSPTPDSTGPAGAEADEWATADTTGIRHLRIRLEGALSARREEGDAESVSWLAAGVKALDDALVYATERDQERRGRLIAEGRYEPFRQECKRLEKEMRKAAALTPSAPIAAPVRDDGAREGMGISALKAIDDLAYDLVMSAPRTCNPEGYLAGFRSGHIDACAKIRDRIRKLCPDFDAAVASAPASDVPGDAQTQEGGR